MNEFKGVSNTRGTVAMAKRAGDPDSATNQWFVNLIDNLVLDVTDGGFTVFGQVIGEGMQIVDAIDDLPTVSLGQAKAPYAPYFTQAYNNPLDFVYINVEVTERFSSAPHVFESATGLLITSVDIDNGSDVISMNFNVVSSEYEVVIKANLDSVIPRQAGLPGIATFFTSDNRLRIPTLEVNLDGAVSLVTNVVVILSDAVNFLFTLESFDQ